MDRPLNKDLGEVSDSILEEMQSSLGKKTSEKKFKKW